MAHHMLHIVLVPRWRTHVDAIDELIIDLTEIEMLAEDVLHLCTSLFPELVVETQALLKNVHDHRLWIRVRVLAGNVNEMLVVPKKRGVVNLSQTVELSLASGIIHSVNPSFLKDIIRLRGLVERLCAPEVLSPTMLHTPF